MQPGKLVICPTPIGNLEDMPPRALAALRNASVVCAEDTRVTGKLLAAFGISKRLERLDEALMGAQAAHIIARVQAGDVVVYCSDAGMPGVSDPGLRLVAAARQAQVPVEVLPGPTAAATAYVASGCTNPRFYFGGFFPRKAGEQQALCQSLRTLDAALIFYESPNRVVAALAALAKAFPFRQAAVCRELTKLHEEVLRDTLPALHDELSRRAQAPGGIKGEIVLVIDGPVAQEQQVAAENAEDAARVRAGELVAQGQRKKDIARTLVSEFGIARNAAYEIALAASRGVAGAGAAEAGATSVADVAGAAGLVAVAGAGAAGAGAGTAGAAGAGTAGAAGAEVAFAEASSAREQ